MLETINKDTKICRICLEAQCELRSIYKTGKILDHSVKLCDILAECTSLVVRFSWLLSIENLMKNGSNLIGSLSKKEFSSVRVKQAWYWTLPSPTFALYRSTVYRTGCFPLRPICLSRFKNNWRTPNFISRLRRMTICLVFFATNVFYKYRKYSCFGKWLSNPIWYCEGNRKQTKNQAWRKALWR